VTGLKAFTQDLVSQMESDLGTRLDWVAIDHWNTDNPHVHLLVRGVAEDGSDLVISRDYISHGLRSRTEDLVSAELGPKPEHEIRSALAREVDAERWTRLDTAIQMAANDIGFIDLRPDQPGADDPEARRFAIGRLQRLERMGLATLRMAGPVDGRSRGRTHLARSRHAGRHHQDHAPGLHGARSGSRHCRLRDP
jgi:type IV secretory pathway VirD2 relaxase